MPGPALVQAATRPLKENQTRPSATSRDLREGRIKRAPVEEGHNVISFPKTVRQFRVVALERLGVGYTETPGLVAIRLRAEHQPYENVAKAILVLISLAVAKWRITGSTG
ncbi:hypothetical protein CLAIMM_02257 [Cladophialophora immunda]|nr:hypothetical protein CLAIMM_02257 [Cladophialophora immunda]